jgi:hypothetical protein
VSGKTSGSTGHSQGRTGGSRKAPRGSRAPYQPTTEHEPAPAWMTARRAARRLRDLTGKQQQAKRPRTVQAEGPVR